MEGAEEVNMNPEGVVEAPNLKRKDCDPSLQSQSCNVMGSPAAFRTPENDWAEPLSSMISPEVFTETLGCKSEVRCTSSHGGSEQPSTIPFVTNESGSMVQELTLSNYRSSNLPAVGCSNNQAAIPLRKGQFPHLYQLSGGLRIGSSSVNAVAVEPDVRENVGNTSPPKLLVQKPHPDEHLDEDYVRKCDDLIRSDHLNVLSNTFSNFPTGIRTKFLQASGFSHLFVKNSLNSKGVTYRYLPTREGCSAVNQVQNGEKAVCAAGTASSTSQASISKTLDLSPCDGAGVCASSVQDGINLREWLKLRHLKKNKVESSNIFKQIVKVVDIAHSQGFAFQDLLPSYFMILPSGSVKYIGSGAPKIQAELSDAMRNRNPHRLDNHHSKGKRSMDQGTHTSSVLLAKHQKFVEHDKLVDLDAKFSAGFGWKREMNKDDMYRAQSSDCDIREPQTADKRSKTQSISRSPCVLSRRCPQLIPDSIEFEKKWYTSPETHNDGACTLDSNIYSLGVLLFELFCRFESWEVHDASMSDIRHRILPPYFLSENPKEAGFCLWLLHPKPTSRPKTREILQSELIGEVRDLSSEKQSSISIDEENAESELLLHFLITLKEQKSKQAAKLAENLGCINTDIEEVERRHSLRTELHIGLLPSEVVPRSSTSLMNEARLVRNIKQLENAYFSVRSKIELPETDAASRLDNHVIKTQHRLFQMQNDDESYTKEEPTDRLGSFFNGICKYARYSKFEVRSIIRSADLNSANVICSLSFDRDEEYFAAAGVSKKIKIFEFDSLLNDTVDIHYPVVELSCKSKLSSICWNNYIKNYLASTDYDGVVQLWDASSGQGLSQYKEHQRRVWSVDFSRVDPRKLATGSDDCSVKLWSINEINSFDTIRNAANVCCVQFSSHSAHLLAFGSADYKIYCYDVRNTRIPWCTLAGHGKAVSYVKFLDPCTLVSASTDNTLKIWDLNKTASSGLSTNACTLTLSGHMNEKNFVGLSVSDGYIACGSETNEVYSYYRSLPMPITSHKFGSIDPISGQETVDDNGQFVSSVCWRGKSNMVVAANSNGSIKLLQLV